MADKDILDAISRALIVEPELKPPGSLTMERMIIVRCPSCRADHTVYSPYDVDKCDVCGKTFDWEKFEE